MVCVCVRVRLLSIMEQTESMCFVLLSTMEQTKNTWLSLDTCHARDGHWRHSAHGCCTPIRVHEVGDVHGRWLLMYFEVSRALRCLTVQQQVSCFKSLSIQTELLLIENEGGGSCILTAKHECMHQSSDGRGPQAWWMIRSFARWARSWTYRSQVPSKSLRRSSSSTNASLRNIYIYIYMFDSSSRNKNRKSKRHLFDRTPTERRAQSERSNELCIRFYHSSLAQPTGFLE